MLHPDKVHRGGKIGASLDIWVWDGMGMYGSKVGTSKNGWLKHIKTINLWILKFDPSPFDEFDEFDDDIRRLPLFDP